MKIDQGVDGLFGWCDGGGSICGVLGVRLSNRLPIPVKNYSRTVEHALIGMVAGGY